MYARADIQPTELHAIVSIIHISCYDLWCGVILKGPTMGGRGHGGWETDTPCGESLGLEFI